MVTLSDDFNRADATTLGTNWTMVSTGAFGITANQAYSVQTSERRTVLTTANTTSDLEVSAKFLLPTISAWLILGHDKVGTADSAAGAYYMFRWNATNTRFEFRRKVALSGTITIAAQTADGQTLTAGDVLSFRRVGAVLTGYRNSVQVLTWTDATPLTTGNHAGMGITGSTAAAFDDFSSVDYSANTPVTITVPILTIPVALTAPAVIAEGPVTIAPPALTVPISLTAPTVTAGSSAPATVTVPPLTIPVSLTAPAVESGETFTAPDLTIPIILTAPTVTAGSTSTVTITVPPLTVPVLLTTPTLRAGSSLATPALTVPLGLTAPTVTAAVAQTVTTPVLTITVSLTAPAIVIPSLGPSQRIIDSRLRIPTSTARLRIPELEGALR